MKTRDTFKVLPRSFVNTGLDLIKQSVKAYGCVFAIFYLPHNDKVYTEKVHSYMN